MSVNSVLLVIFLAMIVLAPMPYGGNFPLPWAVNAFGIGLLVLIYAFNGILRGELSGTLTSKLAVPIYLYLACCAWIVVQTLPVTPSWMHHPSWNAASDALGENLTGAISANPYESRTGLMRLITYAGAFWLALQFGRDRKSATIILHAIVFGIACYSVYGLTLWATETNTVLGTDKADLGTKPWLSSTFINSNNFATFGGLGCIAFFVLCLRSVGKAATRRGTHYFGERLESVLSSFYGVSSLYLLGFILTFVALLLSFSRAGFVFTLAGFAAVLVMFYMRSQAAQAQSGPVRGTLGTWIAVVALGATIVGFYFLIEVGRDKLAEKIEYGVSDVGRASVYPRVVEAIGDFPILGTGFGTFPDVFPIYRDSTVSTRGVWNKAHNTYLENSMELGLPAAFALFAAVGWCVAVCLRGALSRTRSSQFPLIGAGASVLVLLHSAVDFPLQIAGISLTYAALMGVGCAQSWSSRDTVHR